MQSYDVLTETEDGIELWKPDLTYQEAKDEIERAKIEFGGRYWMNPARNNPLDHIPDAKSF